MKKNRLNSYNQIGYVSDNERQEMQKYIASYDEKFRKKDGVYRKIAHGVKYVIYTPLSIAANVISFLFKLGGSIAAIGLPYGIYCAYITATQLREGIALGEIKQTTFVCLFVIFPFTAFAISLLFKKLSDYFTDHQ